MAKKNAAVLPNKPIKVGIPTEDKILYTVVNVVMILWLIIVLFPVIFILASSFSSSRAIMSARVTLWPVEFTTGSYYVVFHYKLIWSSYANTIYYTVVGTVLNLIATTMAAYPLARKNFQFRGFYTSLFIITMFIGGGIIPTYVNMRSLGMLNSRWSMLIPGLIGTSNMIIMRTFFQGIPADLHEAATLDGCSDIRYLVQVVLPLSKAVLSVLTLYYAVGHWNAYFSALLYLRDASKYPLQLVLRTILLTTQGDELTGIESTSAQAAAQEAGESMRYALIVVATVPILMVYPFIQKYFAKGVMIGSLKG